MPATPAVSGPLRPVLLFDGECGLCQRLVNLLLRLDRAGRLRVAPLQGAAAQAWLRAHGLPTADFDSLIFVPDWDAPVPAAYQLRTDGVLAALSGLDRPWRWFAVLRLVPRPLRDAGYRLVARLRHRLFGPPRPGDLGRTEWRGRLLDR